MTLSGMPVQKSMVGGEKKSKENLVYLIEKGEQYAKYICIHSKHFKIGYKKAESHFASVIMHTTTHYYSTITSFHHIRSREPAKYETILTS